MHEPAGDSTERNLGPTKISRYTVPVVTGSRGYNELTFHWQNVY